MSSTAPRRPLAETVLLLVGLVASVAVLLGPQWVPPCGGRVFFSSTTHHCNSTFATVSALALVAAGLAGGSWLWRNAVVRVIQAVLLVVLSLGILIIPRPWAQGICRRPDMSCHQTEIATSAPAVVLLLSSLALLGLGLRERMQKGTQAGVPVDPWDKKDERDGRTSDGLSGRAP